MCSTDNCLTTEPSPRLHTIERQNCSAVTECQGPDPQGVSYSLKKQDTELTSRCKDLRDRHRRLRQVGSQQAASQSVHPLPSSKCDGLCSDINRSVGNMGGEDPMALEVQAMKIPLSNARAERRRELSRRHALPAPASLPPPKQLGDDTSCVAAESATVEFGLGTASLHTVTKVHGLPCAMPSAPRYAKCATDWDLGVDDVHVPLSAPCCSDSSPICTPRLDTSAPIRPASSQSLLSPKMANQVQYI